MKHSLANTSMYCLRYLHETVDITRWSEDSLGNLLADLFDVYLCAIAPITIRLPHSNR